MSTAPAAQSLAILMRGSVPGWILSKMFSSAVLNSSAARTDELAMPKIDHQIGPALKKIKTANATMAAISWSLKLCSCFKA